MIDWHSLSKKEVLTRLESNEMGLKEEEAQLRLEKYGPNQLREIRKVRASTIFLRQFHSILIYILIIAAVVSASLGNWLDAWAISAIVVLNSFIGFIQEYKAEKAIEHLKSMLVPQAKVFRKGKLREIAATEIVPGDILAFYEGDKIMADARVIDCQDLQASEAALTGESMPEDKRIAEVELETPLAGRMDMVYMGTSIVRGSGKAVVTATGMQTEFGKIAGLVQRVKPSRTPLQEKLDVFAKKLGLFIIVLCIAIVAIGVALGFDKLEMFLTGVSLVVSAIPEGLPAVIVICLALTVQRMLRIKSLIRKLPASETLGRTTVICVDKTGTITEEEMRVKELYCSNKVFHAVEEEKEEKEKEEKVEKKERKKIKFLSDNKVASLEENKELTLLLKIGCLCNNARFESVMGKEYITGDPTEKALLIVAKDTGMSKKKLTEAEPRIHEFAFTSLRKMMSIVRDKKGEKISYVKGAPDILLERCSAELVNGSVIGLTKERKEKLLNIYSEMASRALRVLAFAFKHVPIVTQNTAENYLIFVGFQGMLDPPRPEVKPAIKKCHSAGIRVIMITGDSALTAKAIAKEIGLKGDAVEGAETDRMSDIELAEKLRKVEIFARVTPKHKLRIVEILKKQKEIVAVTGDGVNDAPALKRADIGIAMGIRGTDVARDTSDMVLLDDNFASIVKAVEEGRRTDDNTRKFIKYLLSVNFSEISIILFSILIGLPLPLLPLQILWINLVTESIPALALGVEPADKDVMQKKPRNPKEGILSGILPFIIAAGSLIFLTMLIIFILMLPHNFGALIGDALGEAMRHPRTMVLTTSIMFQMLFVFTCRSDKSIFKLGLFTNKWLLYAVGIAIMLHIIAIYTPLSTIFKLAPLGLADWLKVIALSSIGIVSFEIGKILKKK